MAADSPHEDHPEEPELPEDPFGEGDPPGIDPEETAFGTSEESESELLFSGIPFLGDFGSLFAGGPGAGSGGASFGGTSATDTRSHAVQIARQIATGGKAEKNVDPLQRVALEQVTRVAELHVQKITDLFPELESAATRFELVTRTEWIDEAIDQVLPLVERIARQADDPDKNTGESPSESFGDDRPEIAIQFDQAAEQLLRQFMRSPLAVGICAGTLVGNLAKHGFGSYDLLMPRRAGTAKASTVKLIGPNVAKFVDQWSLDINDFMLWLCARHLTLHSVLALPSVAAGIGELYEQYVDGFRYDFGAVQWHLQEQMEQNLGGLEGPPDMQRLQGELQKMFTSPEMLLGVVQTDRQIAVSGELENRSALISGYADRVVATIGSELISSYGTLKEALRRNSSSLEQTEVFQMKLLGGGAIGIPKRVELAEFLEGINVRTNEKIMTHLWSEPFEWPTPNELEAPGLYLARTHDELSSNTGLDLDEDFDLEGLDPDDLKDL